MLYYASNCAGRQTRQTNIDRHWKAAVKSRCSVSAPHTPMGTQARAYGIRTGFSDIYVGAARKIEALQGFRFPARPLCLLCNLRNLRINRPQLRSGSFSPALQHQKQEILRSHCQRKLAYGCGMPLAGTQSIPLLLMLCPVKKSLALSFCRFNQRFLDG